MKKMLIALLLVTGFAMFASDAQAARRYRSAPYRSQNYSYRPTYGGGGLWASFMEFERRKNAMLFGGW
jgi:hypothetical protein